MLERKRQKERERQRETDRQTETERHRETKREREELAWGECKEDAKEVLRMFSAFRKLVKNCSEQFLY